MVSSLLSDDTSLTDATQRQKMGLVERLRSSGCLILAKMRDATATAAVEGFSAALNRMPLAARKTLTYDQGREMAHHAEITQRTGVAIYFCDPHSQEELDAIAFELNMRPRKRFDFKCPIEMMSELMAKHHESPSTIH